MLWIPAYAAMTKWGSFLLFYHYYGWPFFPVSGRHYFPGRSFIKNNGYVSFEQLMSGKIILWKGSRLFRSENRGLTFYRFITFYLRQFVIPLMIDFYLVFL